MCTKRNDIESAIHHGQLDYSSIFQAQKNTNKFLVQHFHANIVVVLCHHCHLIKLTPQAGKDKCGPWPMLLTYMLALACN